jgi:hypothetical protein
MRRFFVRRPSPATAVAFVALLAALSGTAIALPGTNTVDSGDIINGQVKKKDIRKNAVTGKKVKNGSLGGADVKNDSLKGADINESTLSQVPSANSANTAGTANTANSAATAGTANIGLSPVAFAHVDSAGNVIEADSRGVADANVSLESISAYCFRGLSFAFKTAQVSADYADDGGDGEHVQVALGDPWGDCSGGGGGVQLEVAGSDTTAPDEGFEPVGFFIWFYN